MPTWFILVLCSIVINAISEMGQKLALTAKEDIRVETNNFILSVGQAILASVFVLLFVGAIGIYWSLGLLLQFFLMSSISFVAYTLYYFSFKGESVSISQILVGTSVIFSTAFGILFFNESLTPIKILGTILILFSVVFLNWSKEAKALTFNKYNLCALAAGVLIGGLLTVDKAFALTINPHVFQIIGASGYAFVSLLYRGKVIVKDIKRVRKQTFLFMMIPIVGYTIFNKLSFVAYTFGGEVGRIDAINNASVFVIILLEVLLLKDRKSLSKKIIAAAIAFIGVVILGIYK